MKISHYFRCPIRLLFQYFYISFWTVHKLPSGRNRRHLDIKLVQLGPLLTKTKQKSVLLGDFSLNFSRLRTHILANQNISSTKHALRILAEQLITRHFFIAGYRQRNKASSKSFPSFPSRPFRFWGSYD